MLSADLLLCSLLILLTLAPMSINNNLVGLNILHSQSQLHDGDKQMILEHCHIGSVENDINTLLQIKADFSIAIAFIFGSVEVTNCFMNTCIYDIFSMT